jgi:hypothetical protein
MSERNARTASRYCIPVRRTGRARNPAMSLSSAGKLQDSCVFQRDGGESCEMRPDAPGHDMDLAVEYPLAVEARPSAGELNPA